MQKSVLWGVSALAMLAGGAPALAQETPVAVEPRRAVHEKVAGV